MSNRHWRKSQSEDFFVKESKQRGYRSRSVYKLSEIDTKDVEPLIYLSDEVNVLRKDDTIENISQQVLLSTAVHSLNSVEKTS